MRGTGERNSEREQTLAASRTNELSQANTISNSLLPEAVRKSDRISVKVQDQAGEARNPEGSKSHADPQHHCGWRVSRLKVPHHDFVTNGSPADFAAQFDPQPAPRKQSQLVG